MNGQSFVTSVPVLTTDGGYNLRIAALRAAVKAIADKIAPKVYEHGFLST